MLQYPEFVTNRRDKIIPNADTPRSVTTNI